jgi:hypothetical protein
MLNAKRSVSLIAMFAILIMPPYKFFSSAAGRVSQLFPRPWLWDSFIVVGAEIPL